VTELGIASVTGPRGLTLAHYVTALGTAAGWAVVGRTLALATITTILTVSIAVALTYGWLRAGVAGARLLPLVGALPLVTPPFLPALGLLNLVGDAAVGGPLGAWPAIVASQVILFLPHAVLGLSTVFRTVHPDLEDAAETLGASRLTILYRVMWPLGRAGTIATVLVVFTLSMSDFAGPLLLGGEDVVLTTVSFRSLFRAHDGAAAAALAVVLLVPCVVAFAWKLTLVGTTLHIVPIPSASQARGPASPAVRSIFSAVTAVALVAVALVYVAVPFGTLAAGGPPGALSIGGVGSLTRFGSIVSSVVFAVAIGLGGVLASFVIAACTVSAPSLTGRAIAALTMVPLALPGPVVGLGGRLVAGPLSAIGVFAALAASVVVWRLPFGVLAGLERMKRIDRSAAEAAESLGAGTVLRLRRITLPALAAPGASTFVDFFVSGLLTVGTVVFVSESGSALAAPGALFDAGRGAVAHASGLATALVIVAVAAMLFERMLGRREHVPLFAG
jgi:iron(III) transport system permease protein